MLKWVFEGLALGFLAALACVIPTVILANLGTVWSGFYWMAMPFWIAGYILPWAIPIWYWCGWDDRR